MSIIEYFAWLELDFAFLISFLWRTGKYNLDFNFLIALWQIINWLNFVL